MLDKVCFIFKTSSMTSNNGIKINSLLKNTPRGSIFTMPWLKKYNISNKLAWWYCNAGWLEHIDNGVYCYAGDTITWERVVAALQQQLTLPIYPAAKTALQLLGYGHYISMQTPTIQLFAASKIRIPRWLASPYWQPSFKVFQPTLFSNLTEKALVEHEVNTQTLMISSPEKATLELCYLVDKTVTFDETALMIEGLSRMSPSLLQSLLENCQSYRTKRLLLYLGDHYNHAWLTELNLKTIDLGRGKYSIAGGGCYQAKYKLSVPMLGT